MICGSTINNIGTNRNIRYSISIFRTKILKMKIRFKGLVFKTIVDPFIGKISYLKVTQGEIKKDDEIFNINKDSKEKIANLYTMKNKELVEVNKAHCGDIVIITKVNYLQTGDTISSNKEDEEI